MSAPAPPPAGPPGGPPAGPEGPFLDALVPALADVQPDAVGTVLRGARLLVRRADGRAIVLSVAPAVVAWLRTGAPPETARAAAAAFLRAILPTFEHAPAAGPFESVRTRLLPLVLHPAFFLTTDEAAPDAPPLLRFPVVADELSAALVIPGAGASLHFTSGADLARFDRPLAALRAEAIANLSARTRGKLALTLTGEAAARIEDAPWARSSLVLLPEVRARLAEALGEWPLVALPERDTLVALAPGAAAAWRSGLARLRREYEDAAHPLSDALFQTSREGLAFDARLPDALDAPPDRA